MTNQQVMTLLVMAACAVTLPASRVGATPSPALSGHNDAGEVYQDVGIVTGPTAIGSARRVGEAQINLSIGPVSTGSAKNTSDGAIVLSVARFERSLVMHRFHMEVRDSSGALIAGATHGDLREVAWEAVITRAPYSSPIAEWPSEGALTGLRLRADAPQVTLPKPLGYRVNAGDSLVIVLRIQDQFAGASGPVTVHLAIEGDGVEGAGPASRLAVVPLDLLQARPTRAASFPDHVSREWEWISEINGRMLVLDGSLLERASEIFLEDVTSGEVIWRAAAPGKEGQVAFSRPGRLIRLGAQLQQGHTYRITAIIRAGEAEKLTDRTLRAMVMPSRNTQVAAGAA